MADTLEPARVLARRVGQLGVERWHDGVLRADDRHQP